MTFEVINSQQKRVMYCHDWQYVPDNDILRSMQQAGYKFKLDGKNATVKQIDTLSKDKENDKNDRSND